MSNFVANIQAKLNTSGILKEIENIEKNKITFKNISLDTSKLVSDIQSALSKHKFSINFDSVNMSSVSGQMAKSGASAAKSFSSSFNSGMSAIKTTINNTENSIAGMQRTLASMRFDDSSIDLVTKDLEEMNLAISNITTKVGKRSINLSIKGIDELGRAVTLVKSFNYKSGNIKTLGKTISQSFDAGTTSTERFQQSVTQAAAALNNGSIDASIAKVTAQYEKLGVTGHEKLSEIRADIQQLSVIQSEMNGSTSSSDLVSNYEKFNNTLSKVKNNLSIVSAESKTYVSSLQVSTLDNKIETWMNRNSKATKTYGVSLEALRAKLNEMGSSGTATASDLKAVESEFKAITQAAAASGKTGVSMLERMKNSIKSIFSYIQASTIIYQAANAIKQMYQNVSDIDTQMTELKKVTDETAESYNNFLKNTGSTAKELGTTITDLVSSTADFSRLGFSFDDSQELAKVANVYSVVGDEIDSIDDATQSVVSTLTAFYGSVGNSDDAWDIIDKFNEVSNNFAISSGGIGTALQNSASSLAAANNTLDESIALITAANTVVQDPSEVGNAYKTISMRIRGATTE